MNHIVRGRLLLNVTIAALLIGVLFILSSSAQAAKGTYAGTVDNSTSGAIALDVKIKNGFVTKISNFQDVISILRMFGRTASK